MNPQPWWKSLGHGGLLLLVIVYCLFPIYFMLVQSLKSAQEDVFGNPLIVVDPTFENFAELFERHGQVEMRVAEARAAIVEEAKRVRHRLAKAHGDLGD